MLKGRGKEQTQACKKFTHNERQKRFQERKKQRLEEVVITTMWSEDYVVNLERSTNRAVDQFAIQ
jgi:hypothetical protein